MNTDYLDLHRNLYRNHQPALDASPSKFVGPRITQDYRTYLKMKQLSREGFALGVLIVTARPKTTLKAWSEVLTLFSTHDARRKSEGRYVLEQSKKRT